MIRTCKGFNLISVLGFLLLAGGCLLPESTHVEPDYFLLTADGKESNQTENKINQSFYLREIELPRYLRDSRMIRRPTPETIEFRESKRWGEPLEDGIARVLSQNLSDQLGGAHFSIFPNRRKEQLKWDLSVSFARFEIIDGGRLAIEATWVQRDGPKQKSTGSLDLLVDVEGEAGITEEVQAHSTALAILASRIAEDL